MMYAPTPSPAVIAELAASGELRAAINMSNFLLVTGTATNGDPEGVSPDIAAEIARRLGVPLKLVPYSNPGALADAAETGVWDIGNIGAEPQRARTIAFTAAYCEIQATYLVPAGSAIRALADVDRPGVRIAATGQCAYGLWLAGNIREATLVFADTIDGSFEAFRDQGMDVLAGLTPRLLADATRLPGARVLPGGFCAVQQAVGTPAGNAAATGWLACVVEELKRSGRVAELVARHGVEGLSVAPPA